MDKKVELQGRASIRLTINAKKKTGKSRGFNPEGIKED